MLGVGSHRWAAPTTAVGQTSAASVLAQPVWAVRTHQSHGVCLAAVLSLSLSIQGVARLADISLHNPVCISVLDESHGQSDPKGRAVPEVWPPQASDELHSFAIPERLDQHVALVPSKLRLVSLAAFILQKCKVGLDETWLDPGEKALLCLCQALMAAR